MRLALLSPVHGQSIDQIARQLENYRAFLNPFQLRHYLHISEGSSIDLKDNLIAFAQRNDHDIVITERSRSTWSTCTAHAFCELVHTALNDDVRHDKVLIHTDTDLLFSAGAVHHLRNHSIGCESNRFRGAKGRWKWSPKVLNDPRIQRFVHEMLDGEVKGLRQGRVCGAFMPWSVFKPFGVLFNHFFDDQYFDMHAKQRWPLNEVAIPTLLRLLVGTEVPFANVLIKTPQRKKLYTRKSIRRSLRSGDCFGLKKISLSPDDKIFRFVMKLQNKIEAESC